MIEGLHNTSVLGLSVWRIVSNLTAASFLMHVLAGCCWHHEHAGSPSLAEGSAAVCCDGHAHVAVESATCHHGQSDPHQHDGKPCADGACFYVISDSLRTSAASAVQSLDAGGLARISAHGPSIDSSPLRGYPAVTGSNAPLRLHLLHQVLLI